MAISGAEAAAKVYTTFLYDLNELIVANSDRLTSEKLQTGPFRKWEDNPQSVKDSCIRHAESIVNKQKLDLRNPLGVPSIFSMQWFVFKSLAQFMYDSMNHPLDISLENIKQFADDLHATTMFNLVEDLGGNGMDLKYLPMVMFGYMTYCRTTLVQNIKSVLGELPNVELSNNPDDWESVQNSKKLMYTLRSDESFPLA